MITISEFLVRTMVRRLWTFDLERDETLSDLGRKPPGLPTVGVGLGVESLEAAVPVVGDPVAHSFGRNAGSSNSGEGTDEAGVFTVRLSRAASHAVTVDWSTADGSHAWVGTPPATAGADYTASSGTITFAPGERFKSVQGPILDDAVDEGMEYFLLRFSNPDGAALPARYRDRDLRR